MQNLTNYCLNTSEVRKFPLIYSATSQPVRDQSLANKEHQRLVQNYRNSYAMCIISKYDSWTHKTS